MAQKPQISSRYVAGLESMQSWQPVKENMLSSEPVMR